MLNTGLMAEWLRYSSSEKYTLPTLAVDSPKPPRMLIAKGAMSATSSSDSPVLLRQPPIGRSSRGVASRNSHTRAAA